MDLPTTAGVIGEIDGLLPPLVLVQHIRPDTASLVDLLVEHGHPIAGVVGIPYSVDQRAASAIERRGVRLVLPESGDLRAQLAHLVSGASERPIVQEVGGYFADLLDEDPARAEWVRGVVEETKQGLWRYQTLEASNRLACPVVQIADSALKELEALHVGLAISLSCADWLRAHNRVLIGAPVGIVGYGSIGAGVARVLRGMGAHVVVHDSNPVRMVAAEFDGYRTASRDAVLGQSFLLVCCTGRTHLSTVDVTKCPQHAVIASGSSRQVEFEPDLLATCEPIDAEVPRSDISPRFRPDVTVLYGAYPVNFGGASLPGPVIDLVFAQIVDGVRMLRDEHLANGVYPLADDRLRATAARWSEARNSHS